MKDRKMIERWKKDSIGHLKVNLKNRILPTIYGGIIGDCLGVPVEFEKRGTYMITDMIGYGTYNQPPGTWSDDSSLTLCLMENIVQDGTEIDLMEKFVKYRAEGYLTPYNQMFDIGQTTSNAIDRFLNGVEPSNCGGKAEQDNGNGALMRISPMVFELYHNFDFIKKCEVIKNYTEITHAHPRCILGSIIFVELLIRLNYNNSIEDSLKRTKELIDDNFLDSHEYQKEMKYYSRIFQDNFFELREDEIRSSGYVVDTLEAAIWCLGTTRSFEEAVLKAVNLGDDTDTIASITGSLAGMFYKMEGIPEKWLNQIAEKEKVDKMVNEFMLNCVNKAVIREYGEL